MLCLSHVNAAELSLTQEQLSSLGIATTRITAVEHRAIGTAAGRIVIPSGAQALVTAPFDAIVIATYVHENQAVRAGAPLARLRSSAAAQAFATAQRHEAIAQTATAQARRDEQLAAEGIVAARRAQESAAEAQAASAAANAARSLLRSVRVAPSRADEFDLIAPVAGVVQEHGARVGAELRADALVFGIVTAPLRWVEAQASDRMAQQVHVGSHVELAVANRAQNVFRGEVIAVGNRVDPATRGVLLRAAIAAGQDLIDGQLVEVAVFEDSAVPLFEVPAAAVVRDAGQESVFVRTATGFRLVAVQAGTRVAGRVIVQGELTAQDEVVIAGTSALKALAAQE